MARKHRRNFHNLSVVITALGLIILMAICFTIITEPDHIPTPTPTNTAVVITTIPPIPTSTPTLVPTVVPTHTPTPTEVPVDTVTPTPTPTKVPTATPTILPTAPCKACRLPYVPHPAWMDANIKEIFVP